MTKWNWLVSPLMLSLAGACATPGARPEDMSAAAHQRQSDLEVGTAQKHQEQFEATARTTRERCRGRPDTARVGVDLYDICWSSVTNPTESHLGEAELHRRRAADHRAAAAALGEAEGRACAGVSPDDRDISPFEHVEDIEAVEPLTERATGKAAMPRTSGAIVTFRAVPGLTAEWLQRVVDCHLARNASLGHEVPEMPSCPLVPKGAEARVSSTGNGFSVAIRSDDPASAAEILSRANRLRHPPPPTR